MGPRHISQTLTNAMGPSTTKCDGERQAVWLAQPRGRLPELSLCWDQWDGVGVCRSQASCGLARNGPLGTWVHRLREVHHGGGSGWHLG